MKNLDGFRNVFRDVYKKMNTECFCCVFQDLAH